jgi:hypothetical protein
MRLLDLRVQVDDGGELAIEQSDRSRADLLWQSVPTPITCPAERISSRCRQPNKKI